MWRVFLKFCVRRAPEPRTVACFFLPSVQIADIIRDPDARIESAPTVHCIITVKLNGCLWNSAQWLWTQYHRMMIITHCHALCGGCTFAYFTQVWQSAKWHYRSKQGNLCNLISANKQPRWNQCSYGTVTGILFLSFFMLFSSFLFYKTFLIETNWTPSKQLAGFFLPLSKFQNHYISMNR